MNAPAEDGVIEAGPKLIQRPRVRQEVWTVSSGVVAIWWPESMTAEDLKDVEELLEIVRRKIRRACTEKTL